MGSQLPRRHGFRRAVRIREEAVFLRPPLDERGALEIEA